jgi:uncharacterized membrane protein
VLAAILALGAALRVAALNTPLYIDEIVSITVAVQPLSEMPRVMRLIDASPALAPLLLHAWLQVLDSDAWARLLMAVFGWLTIPVAYGLAARAFDRRSATWAAFAVAIAPSLVHYSQYVRNYSLFTLLAAVHLTIAVAWFGGGQREWRSDGEHASTLSDRPSAAETITLVLVTTALLYTHYISLLYFMVPGCAALWYLRARRARAVAWITAHLLAVVLFLPGVPLLEHNIRADAVRNEQRPLPPPPYVLAPNVALEMFVGQRTLGFSDPVLRRWTLVGASVVFPALVILATAARWRTDRTTVLLLFGTATVPVLVYIVTGRRLVAVRFFLPSIVSALVLAGHGMRVLPTRLRAVAAAALCVLAAVPLWHFYTQHAWSYDHKAVARELSARARPGDVIVVVHPYEAFYYRRYLGLGIPIVGATFTPLTEQPEYVIKPEPLDAAAARSRLEGALASARRIWVIGASRRSFASSDREQQALLEWMSRRYGELARLDGLTGGDPEVRLYGGAALVAPAAGR